MRTIPLWLSIAALSISSPTFARVPTPGPRTVRSYGPAGGLRIVLRGDAREGYAAVIYDGQFLVSTRGKSSPWDLEAVASGAKPEPRMNRYTRLRYETASRTLFLEGAVDRLAAGVTISRWESYRFLPSGEIDARLGVSSDGPVRLHFSPYTEFAGGSHPFWVSGSGASYESPLLVNGELQYISPIPVLGVAISGRAYGVASGSTWEYPLPGVNMPRIVVDGRRLAAPQIGTAEQAVALQAGERKSWQTVFFRTENDPYTLALDGQIAIAHAHGFDLRNSPGAQSPRGVSQTPMQRKASLNFGLICRATALWARLTTAATPNPNPVFRSADGKRSVTPAAFYNPGTWMRDSFWTGLGLAGSALDAETEAVMFKVYSDSIPRSGPTAGRVPLLVAFDSPFEGFDDESGLYYLIRMYRDSEVLRLPVKDLELGNLVLRYILDHQTENERFLTAGPAPFLGRPFSPNGWLDGYGYRKGDTIAGNQGLFAVALESAQRLGLSVSGETVAAARKRYAELYDPALGYMRWLSSKDYKSPDVLIGEALSLYLFDQPILTDDVVLKTLRAQVWTPYGMRDLATATGGYVDAGEFLNTTNNGLAREPQGWYQNGDSWFLWEYLAEYAAARHGAPEAREWIARSVAAEVAVTPMSKEFKITKIDPELNKSPYDTAFPYPLGATDWKRNSFGWNSAFAAFQADLQQGVETPRRFQRQFAFLLPRIPAP